MRVRPSLVLAAATVAAVALAAACNQLLHNGAAALADAGAEPVDPDAAVGPSDAAIAQPDPDPDAALPPLPEAPTGCRLPAGDAVYSSCAGGAPCLPAGAPIPGTFARVQSVPGGVLLQSATSAVLVTDPGDGSPYLVRPLQLHAGGDDGIGPGLGVIADYQYLYALQMRDGLGLLRARRDFEAVETGLIPVEPLANALDKTEQAGETWLMAAGPGAIVGVQRRFDHRFGLGQLFVSWQDQTATVVGTPADASYFTVGSVHAVYGALALGRVLPGSQIGETDRLSSPDQAQWIRRTPASLGNFDSWSVVAQDLTGPAPGGGSDPEGTYARRFVDTFVIAGCEDTLALVTSVDDPPMLYGQGAGEATIRPPVLVGPPPASTPGNTYASYLGGFVTWSVERDLHNVYLAPHAADDAGTPPPADFGREILVLEASIQAPFEARIPVESTVEQLAVSACYVFWRDDGGGVHSFRKPGPTCNPG